MKKFRTIKSALFFALTIIMLSAAAEKTVTETKSPPVEPESVQDMSSKSTKQDFKPARKFTPSEKLRADDAVSFPVDI